MSEDTTPLYQSGRPLVSEEMYNMFQWGPFTRLSDLGAHQWFDVKAAFSELVKGRAGLEITEGGWGWNMQMRYWKCIFFCLSGVACRRKTAIL